MPLHVKKDKILDKNVSEILNLRKLPCTTDKFSFKKYMHMSYFFHNLKTCYKNCINIFGPKHVSKV